MRSARLKELGEIITGNTPKTSEIKNYESDDICFVKPSDIDDKSISKLKNSEYYISEYARKSARIAPKHSILVTCIGIIGKIAILENECAFNQQINAIVPDEKQVYPLYLAYNMFFQKKYLQQKANAPVVPIINKTDFGEFKIKLHNLIEQQKIVDVLDKVENLIDNRQQQLNLLDDLIESRFIEMFGDPVTNPMGWEMKKLDDISDVGSSKRVFVEELKNTGIPFFRGTEIGLLAEGQNIKPEFYITEQHYNELCKISGKPQYGDLLMSSICSDGRIWLVKDDFSFYFKDGRVLWIHNIVKSVNNLFLKYVLKEKFISDYEHIASGTTFKELKIFILKQLTLPCPPIELQNKFATFVEQTEKTKSTIKKSLDELNLLKDSLMQKYFG